MAKYEIKDGVGIIPEGTKSIVNDAFKNCTELTSIVIPDSVNEIGSDAFYGCTGLTSIVIPDSVKMIKSSAFCYCKSLTEVTLPDGVTAISMCLFYECESLKTINIPTSVTLIEEHAFHGCTSLTSINIPDSVTAIGDCAFYQCTGLKDIVIPKSVKTIVVSVFEGCTVLQTVTIFAPSILKKGLFMYCKALETVTFGIGIKKINESAFIGCNSLKTINVPINKAEYYRQLLCEKLQPLIKETELAGSAKPSAKKTSAKPVAAKEPALPKKVFKVIFNCDCYEGFCAKFVDNATPFDELGYRIDFEQRGGKLEEKTKKILLTSALYDMMVVEEATGKILKVDQDPGQVVESWVEKKLALEPGNRYYIQGMQEHYGGTFTKRITFKIETENEFDISKLVTICDSKFDDLYWKIQKGETEGVIIHDIEPDEGLINPYELYYDGKEVKASKVSTPNSLRGEAYMCFDWQ